MKEVTRLFSDLKNISGNIAKADFIRTNMSNKTFMNSLRFLIRTDNPTGISTKKYDKWEDSDSMFIDESKNPPKETTLEDIFSYLEVHNSGRDEDVRYIRTFGNVWCEDEEDKEFYKRIICKDYPIGVDAKSLNKIVPNFIRTFDVMLCDKFADHPDVLDGNTEYEITCKTDGGRCVAIKRNGITTLMSRQGKVWNGLHEIEDAINNLSEDNIVLDGELTIYDFLNYPSDEVYKATMKIVSSKDEDKKGITLNCFDILTVDEWDNGCKTIQKDRRIHLDKLLTENKSKALFCLPSLYIGKDPSKVSELMKTIVEPNNWEGLVIKTVNSLYEHKRSKTWLKVKQMETYDLRIVDTFEGENALVGKLGGFIAEVTLPDGKFVHTKIGSGFSLVDRSDLWLIKDSLIGKAIEVQGFELTTNDKSDSYSIRFPVFKGFIEEGKELNGDYKGI